MPRTHSALAVLAFAAAALSCSGCPHVQLPDPDRPAAIVADSPRSGPGAPPREVSVRERGTDAPEPVTPRAAAKAIVAPDVEVTLGSTTWRPEGAGEPWGESEARWTLDVDTRYRLLVDRKSDGQVRVTVESRIWHDLPPVENPETPEPAKPTFESKRLRVVLDRVEVHDGTHRFHHNTRPTLVFNRSARPTIDRTALEAAGYVPPYRDAITVPESTIRSLEGGSNPFFRWDPDWPWDRLTENYENVVGYWAGGTLTPDNEAAFLPSIHVCYLFESDPRIWDRILANADSAGNYALHFRHRGTGAPINYQQSADGVPPPTLLKVRNIWAPGHRLPQPDGAHNPSLTYLPALLTGERYYYEEIEFQLGYNMLEQSKDADRAMGLIWGEQRMTYWSWRNIHHLILLNRAAEKAPGARAFYEDLLRRNLQWVYANVVNPAGPLHDPMGVQRARWKDNPWSMYMPGDARPPHRPEKRIVVWQGNVFAYFLTELARCHPGNLRPLAAAARDHWARISQGQWENTPAPGKKKMSRVHDSVWSIVSGDHATWAATLAHTFTDVDRERPRAPTSYGQYGARQYQNEIQWFLSGILANIAKGEPWAPAVKDEIDAAAAAHYDSRTWFSGGQGYGYAFDLGDDVKSRPVGVRPTGS